MREHILNCTNNNCMGCCCNITINMSTQINFYYLAFFKKNWRFATKWRKMTNTIINRNTCWHC
uniref:Candidate secreted effector n=1 Tax=Meloidogyne incognita TaxID=6306 RepID=A0A914MWD6_MELIC